MLVSPPSGQSLAPELLLPGLERGRSVVGEWLIPELAGRLGVPWDEMAQVFAALPTNYVHLLDTAEGINLLAIMSADLLGLPHAEPFFSRHQ
jgi:hypothetical protein